MTMLTLGEARAIFEERMQRIRESLDSIPREFAQRLPPEKRFLAERLLRVRIHRLLASQPTFEEFLGKIRERRT